MNVSNDVENNMRTAQELIDQAMQSGAEMCFFPESADFIGFDAAESRRLAEKGSERALARYQDMARNCCMWLSLCLHLFDHKAGLLRNSHVIVSSAGEVMTTYDKCHLFDVDIPGRVQLSESRHTKAGESFGVPQTTPVGIVAPMICYDLRFPEISTAMRSRGAEILTYPSAFTVVTGQAHWEVLLRARAIENQCYVVAAAQCGAHNAKRTSYGHSMVVDPWGEVVSECKENKPAVITADIDLNRLHELRRNMPVFQHRREDLY